MRIIYKTSLEEQNQKLVQQNWRCPLCGRSFIGDKKFSAYQDHDHKCCARRKKKFCGKCNRGLLCYICNKWVIGLIEKMRAMKEHPPDFRKALDYIDYWTKVIELKGGYVKEIKTRRLRTRK